MSRGNFKPPTLEEDLRAAQIEAGRILGKYTVLLIEHTKHHHSSCICMWCEERRALTAAEDPKREAH